MTNQLLIKAEKQLNEEEQLFEQMLLELLGVHRQRTTLTEVSQLTQKLISGGSQA